MDKLVREGTTVKRGWKRVCFVAMPVVVGMGLLWFLPSTDRDWRDAMMRACTVSWYELPVTGGDTLYFSGMSPDSLLENFSSSSDKARREFQCNAFFISYSGRLVTVADTAQGPEILGGRLLEVALRKEADRQEVRARYCREMLGEMAYYERTHSVVDEGFNQVMDYEERLKGQLAEAERLHAAIGKVLESPDATARLRMRHEVYCRMHDDGAIRIVPYSCRKLAENEDGAAVWQTETGLLPSTSACIRPNPFPYTLFHSCTHLYKVWGYFGKPRHVLLADTVGPAQIRVRLNDMVPSVPMTEGADGASVSGKWGCLNGMMVRGRCVSAFEIYRLQLKGTPWYRCVWEDLKAWVGRLYGKTKGGRG